MVHEAIKVLFEDNHLLAVAKPAGWLVHGDETGDESLLDWAKEYIKIRYQKPGAVYLGVIHRIDRPVSGVVIFARTSKALERMNELFKKREVEKTYWAITDHRPDPLEGTLTDYLVKDNTKNMVKALDRPSRRNPDAKKSVLNYKLIAEIDKHFLLKVNPITGRSHQIRVQLAKKGWPIIGDVKYGHKTPNHDGSIYLHCRSMSFVHPIKKEKVTITANSPKLEFWNWFGEWKEEGV
ncbi:MAG: RNA pseudouridine synthase [Saprospiraceae bacterium]|nr:RNA pseudouridine synthase [Saprospiraceae bacterium]